MNSDQLAETTLDPENRNLIRLTSKDAEKDCKRFGLLHGDSEAMRQERSNLMAKAKIDIEDIDT